MTPVHLLYYLVYGVTLTHQVKVSVMNVFPNGHCDDINTVYMSLLYRDEWRLVL